MSDKQPYGLNSHQLQNTSLEFCAEAGIPWHRIDVEWADIERADGVDDWTETDRIVETAERLRLHLLAILAYTPSWQGPREGSVPKDPQRFWDFCARAASRYGSQIAAWSVWNEPNLKQFWEGSLDQFVALWRGGLLELRNTLPNAVLVGPDLSSTKNNTCLKDWMPRLLDAGRDLLNVVSHHQYDGHDTVQGRVSEIARIHAFLEAHGFGNLPLWITEIGWDRVTPERQAELLRDTMQSMQMRSWWSKTFWYDSHGAGWGILHPDGHPQQGAPKPAFHAYRQLIEESTPPQEGD